MFRILIATLSILFAALALLGPGPSGPSSTVAGFGSAGLLSDPRAFNRLQSTLDQPVRVARDVRIWAEPTLKSPVVGLLRGGEEVQILHEARPGWMTVMLSESVGYIPARAVERIAN